LQISLSGSQLSACFEDYKCNYVKSTMLQSSIYKYCLIYSLRHTYFHISLFIIFFYLYSLSHGIFHYLACTISFTSFDVMPATYVVTEDDGPAQPVLVLSNPSSTDITFELFTTFGSATGEYLIIL